MWPFVPAEYRCLRFIKPVHLVQVEPLEASTAHPHPWTSDFRTWFLLIFSIGLSFFSTNKGSFNGK